MFDVMKTLSSVNKTSLLGSVLPPERLYNTRVAKAINEYGEVVLSVNYAAVGKVFLITSISVHPFASGKDKQHAGDVIDLLLEREAASLGISTLLMLIPGKDEAIEVRTYLKTSQTVTTAMSIGCPDTTPSAKYLN